MRLPVCGARLRLTPSCLLRRSLKTGDQGPRGMIRRVFAELDEDNSGFMNKEEFKKLVAKCGGRKRKLKEITEIFSRLDDGDDGTPGQISFKVFETWFVEEMKSDVRAARVLARQLFTLSDSDDSGTLDKAEFGKIAAHLSSKFPQIVLEPDFDLQNDWEKMTKMAADAQVGAQPLQTTARPFLLTVSNPSLSAHHPILGSAKRAKALVCPALCLPRCALGCGCQVPAPLTLTPGLLGRAISQRR